MSPSGQTTRLYRYLAAGFALVTALLLVTIASLTAGRAAITVSLASRPVSTTFSVTVSDRIDGDRLVRGKYLTSQIDGEKTVTAAAGAEVPAKASGTVRIVNITSRVQPLAATTRLLSEAGVLFRTTERVDVPANGSVTINVEADQPGAGGEIGPSRFTLPGLRPENQQLIYGESDNPMTGGTTTTSAITEADRAVARETLASELVSQALTRLEDEVRNEGLPFVVAILSQSVTERSTAAGLLRLGVAIEALTYDPTVLRTVAAAELGRTLPEGFVVTDVDLEGIRFTLRSVDADGRSAVVGLSVSGSTALDEGSPFLAPSRFAGKTRAEVLRLGNETEGVASAEVRLTPGWLRRTPKQPDRISVLINRPSVTPGNTNATIETDSETNS